MDEKKLVHMDTTHGENAAQTAEESQLNKEITFGFLMKYALPTMVALVVFSGFGLIDGIFASRGISPEAMAAMTAFMPVFALMPAIGLLFAGGGSAVILRKVGMGHNNEARRNFSSVLLTAFILLLLVPIFVTIFPTALLNLLGVNSVDYAIYNLAIAYLRIAAWALPFMAIGQIFNQFLIADGKPNLSMIISVLTSVIGVVMNYIVIFVFEWGMEGLAWTTIVGTAAPAFVQFFVFANNKTGVLRFARPGIDIKTFGRIILIGLAGFIPATLGAFLFLLMNRLVAQNLEIGAFGIAIAGIVMGLFSVITQPINGYVQGIGPIISYNYGKADHDRQKKLFKYNFTILVFMPLLFLAVGNIFANVLVGIYDFPDFIHDMAVRGLRIKSLTIIFMGLNILAITQFAALCKGTIATILSTSQMLLINIPLLIILPRFWDITGVWLAAPITSATMIFATIPLLFGFGRKYGYL
ncbi:MAG: MATE family efflux transporter [Firmicutes bacterium]|nr:MATE family efflux transporter [Bacillota bacterium]